MKARMLIVKNNFLYILAFFVILISGEFFLLSGLGLAKNPSNGSNSEVGVLSGKGYTIKLREDGFTPYDLTIKQGDTVTFVTSRNKPFWPASNIHPAHTDYLGFDPRRPIAPDATWSFTFEKTGRWEYHDHLAPIFYKGVIIVREK